MTPSCVITRILRAEGDASAGVQLASSRASNRELPSPRTPRRRGSSGAGSLSPVALTGGSRGCRLRSSSHASTASSATARSDDFVGRIFMTCSPVPSGRRSRCATAHRSNIQTRLQHACPLARRPLPLDFAVESYAGRTSRWCESPNVSDWRAAVCRNSRPPRRRHGAAVRETIMAIDPARVALAYRLQKSFGSLECCAFIHAWRSSHGSNETRERNP